MGKNIETKMHVAFVVAGLFLLAGIVLVTIASVQEFGFAGIFLDSGVFRLWTLIDQPMAQLGFACEAVSLVVFLLGVVRRLR